MSGSTLEVYKHSGALPPAGLALTLGGGALAAGVLGWLYSDFICRVPWIYFNFVATLVLGYAVGAVVSRLSKLGQLRHPGAAETFSLLAACAGLYVAWARDRVIRGLVEDAAFTLAPGALLAYVDLFAAQGGWSIEEFTPTGALLYMVWLAETCCVLGAAWVGSRDALESDVFCEACACWTAHQRGLREMSREAFDGLLPQVKQGDVAALVLSRVGDPGGKNFVRLDLSTCPRCTESNYLRPIAVTTRIDSKGVPRRDETALSPPLRLPGAALASVRGAAPAWRAAGLEPSGAAPPPDDAIRLRCPRCRQESRIPPRYAGRRGRCPKCREEVQVPEA